MDKIKSTKKVLSMVAGLGGGIIAGLAIEHVVPGGIGKVRKFLTTAGALVITDLVATKTADHAEVMFDDAVDSFRDGYNDMNEAIKDVPVEEKGET